MNDELDIFKPVILNAPGEGGGIPETDQGGSGDKESGGVDL